MFGLRAYGDAAPAGITFGKERRRALYNGTQEVIDWVKPQRANLSAASAIPVKPRAPTGQRTLEQTSALWMYRVGWRRRFYLMRSQLS